MTASAFTLVVLQLSFLLGESVFVRNYNIQTPHLIAAFGPPIPRAGIAAPLVVAEPFHACSPILGDFNGSVVLIQRGVCNFADKVFQAQKKGALASIIMDNKLESPPGALVRMGTNKTFAAKIHIPSVFVSLRGGIFLRSLAVTRLQQGDPAPIVVLNSSLTGGRFIQWGASQWRVLQRASVAVLVIWAFFLVFVASARLRKRQNRHRDSAAVRSLVVKVYSPPAPDNTATAASDGAAAAADSSAAAAASSSSARQLPLSGADCETKACAVRPCEDTAAATAASLPGTAGGDGEVAISIGSGGSGGGGAAQASRASRNFDMTVCVICLCDFEAGERLMELPCRHQFHQECVQPWLVEKKDTCPVCKRSILQPPSPPPSPSRRRRRRRRRERQQRSGSSSGGASGGASAAAIPLTAMGADNGRPLQTLPAEEERAGTLVAAAGGGSGSGVALLSDGEGDGGSSSSSSSSSGGEGEGDGEAARSFQPRLSGAAHRRCVAPFLRFTDGYVLVADSLGWLRVTGSILLFLFVLIFLGAFVVVIAQLR